ncbi:MAG: glycosyltransferase family 39 protein [Candidatus Micrarchaeota archaeon]
MNILSLAGLLIAYFLPGYLLSFLLFKNQEISRAERALFSFTASISILGALMHILGLTFGFNFWLILLLPLFICALLYFFARKELETSFSIPKFELPALSLLEKLALAVILLQLIFALYYSVFFPIEGGDAVAYHAPYAKLFYQAGRIYNPEGFLDITNAVPHATHLIGTWFYILDGGVNDLFLRLLSPLCTLFFTLLVFLFAQKLFNRQTAIISTAIFASIPLVVAHASSAYINLPEAFFASSALYFLHLALKSKETRHYLAAGLLTGFVPLLKHSGFIALFIAGALLLLFRPKLKHILLFSLAFFLFLSPIWYMRDIVEFGSPFYPHSLFGEAKPYGTPPHEFFLSYFFDGMIAINWGIGPFLLTFGLAGLYYLNRSRYDEKFLALWLLGAIIFTSLFTQSGRFMLWAALPIAVLAGKGACELISRNNGLWRTAVFTLLLLQILPMLFLGVVSFKTSRIAYGEGTLALSFYFPPPQHEEFLEGLYGDDAWSAYKFINSQTPSNSKIISVESPIYFIDRPLYVPEHMQLPDKLEPALLELKEKGITHILVTHVDKPPNYLPLQSAFQNLNNTKYFELVYSTETAQVYRIR